MTRMKFIEIDGKRYLWSDLLGLRREQKKAQARVVQPPLFELKNDRRPAADRTASDRYRAPSLFRLDPGCSIIWWPTPSSWRCPFSLPRRTGQSQSNSRGLPSRCFRGINEPPLRAAPHLFHVTCDASPQPG